MDTMAGVPMRSGPAKYSALSPRGGTTSARTIWRRIATAIANEKNRKGKDGMGAILADSDGRMVRGLAAAGMLSGAHRAGGRHERMLKPQAPSSGSRET
jgi:hypothetical protein